MRPAERGEILCSSPRCVKWWRRFRLC